ncbi:hypothetical protein ACFXKC_51095 [Streptomyces sp. NPDC059340]|uniref:hypothetical protein n=1 Tax=Streptomyces sp. NPDC059340 TaxID=3346806 RepID=UPI0036BA10ED
MDPAIGVLNLLNPFQQSVHPQGSGITRLGSKLMAREGFVCHAASGQQQHRPSQSAKVTGLGAALVPDDRFLLLPVGHSQDVGRRSQSTGVAGLDGAPVQAHGDAEKTAGVGCTSE